MLSPGYDRDTPSMMCSPWNRFFRSIGYEELDVVEHNDGSWGIRQYHTKPIIPSLTRWSWVLQDIRHTLITESFLKSQAEQLDLERHTVWDRLRQSEKAALLETEAQERRAQDWADAAWKGVRGNDALIQRIAKNGIKELDPRRMLNHIDKRRLGKHGKGLTEK